MFLNILVGIDGSGSSLRALDHAVNLARAGNAKLTIITVAPPVSSYVTLAGTTPEKMRAELDKWASGLLEQATKSIRDDVLVHTIERHGNAGHEIVKEIKHGGYDLVVLGTRGRGRTQEGLLGSVNGYVHFHSHVPLLTVPEDSATEQLEPEG